jgi:thioredoxin reductase (NADPH)
MAKVSEGKVAIQWNHTLDEVTGDDSGVTGMVIRSTKDEKTTPISLHGLFIAIGHKPNTGLFTGVLDMEENGYLATRPGSSYTNIPGVFACGDVQDHTYRQAITAAGSGCMAAIDCERWLESEHASLA